MRRVAINLVTRTLILMTAAAAFTARPASAADPSAPVYKVEEDWELVVIEPDALNFSPQVNLFISPLSEAESQYFQLQLNYAAENDFSGGGFRVAALATDTVVDQARSATSGALSHNQDNIAWTNVMAVINNEFLFAVKNGTSLAWGNFGGPEYLVRMPAGAVVDLSGYDYANSASTAEVSFGKNRVSKLVLHRVRLYKTDGTFSTIQLSSP